MTILHKTKIPAIYVTHDQDEAFTIADRILLLQDGEIIRDGTPDEVWKNPNSAHAARMLGVGNVIEGGKEKDEASRERGSCVKVATEYGVFEMTCKHNHKTERKFRCCATVGVRVMR